ncbi:heterogeneous nuclear ribonucleo F isoform A [Chlorella sorokiniana]|uniref:Heterogeneous nuclear ribonucleo F isoform A n=1 Tax=Chlorella sorokiniana TaxID=3076 RepID=A0A2P6U5K5_CHLSO|nr:heterogeneous nuclear ribonucleo F isoform A [Chlorella sorokiniana]|eukprot:PRW61587.1 heterogeneous nuclear ribonucleo F isoform A [Chlorella sorokiniana]
MTALGLGAALAFGAAALSMSWVFIPLLAAVFGMPALMAGGMAAGVFATAAAGAFLLPTLVQLALIGGGLWLGATVVQAYFGGGGGTIDPDSTIDVEAHSVDDDWRNEMFREKREREQELRDFDDLTGEAYVVFNSLEEAQKACSKDKDIFCPKSGDRYVRVSIEQDVSAADLAATSNASSGKVPNAKRGGPKLESVVKVSGLPRTITPPEVLSLFWGWQVRPASTYILGAAEESPHVEALVDFQVQEHAALAVAQRHGTTITTAAGVFQLSVRHASKAEWDAAVAAQQVNDGILRVKGLPTQAGPSDVLAFFQSYNIKPGGVHVQPASENKRSKQAMVEFEGAAEAARALEKNRQQFGGTDRFCLLLHASRAELEQELARFQQQQQQQQPVPAASGSFGYGPGMAPHPGAMAAAAAAAASMGVPGAGGLQPWGPAGVQPAQAPNTAAARYMVQDLTTGQRVFLDPRFNLSSFGVLPPAFASSAAATAGTTAGGTATAPARDSQRVQSELDATATSGGPEEQQLAGQAGAAAATADGSGNGSGEGSGEGPSGSGAIDARGGAVGNGNGHSSGNGHSVAAAGGASVRGHGVGAADGSGHAMLGTSGQSEQKQQHRHHHHRHKHHSHHHHHHQHAQHCLSKPSSSGDEGRTNGGSGGGSNEGSDVQQLL